MYSNMTTAAQETNTVSDNLIPVNAPVSEVDPTTVRFSSAIWYEEVQKQSVILAGCGGIGSYVGFLLGRMKPRVLYLYDNDVVETANLSGQLFSRSDVRIPKVEAVRRMLANSSGYERLYANRSRFDHYSTPGPIMICGFDNMEARKIFFQRWEDYVQGLQEEEERTKTLFIDGRLAAEEFQVFAFTGDNDPAKLNYEANYLFSDEEAEETLCSFKQTSYMANMIASVMVNIFTNFCANQCGLILPREVPFMTSYSADFMELKTSYL